MKDNIKRGDIYFADLEPVVGSEQGGIRPAVIIQNDVGNHHSPTVIIAAITAKTRKTNLPTHIQVDSSREGLEKDSIVLLEQLRTIDKSRLREYIGRLNAKSLDGQGVFCGKKGFGAQNAPYYHHRILTVFCFQTVIN